MIRPLRSTPITGAATLLRGERPLGTALVFGLVGPPLVPFPFDAPARLPRSLLAQ